MSNNTTRTANGQEIDLQKIMLKNEGVRAVGNMNVNARGDVLDNKNKTTATRAAQVNKNYRKQIGNVAQDVPVVSSKKAADRTAAQQAAIAEADEILEELDGPPVTVVEEPVKAKPKQKAKPKKKVAAGGLASAIAKAKEVKQETQATPRENERSGDGVKKI